MKKAITQTQYRSSKDSLREVVPPYSFSPHSSLVLFGEIFQRGYANGLLEHAEKQGLKIIGSTVGRREKDLTLRALNEEEVKSFSFPIINVPLEAGFDLTPSSAGVTPVDQLRDVKLSDWSNAKLDWAQIEQSREKAREDFRQRVKSYVAQLEKILPPKGDIVFAHLMAGGVPRAKIVMPLMNRVFKGMGERHLPSKEFWESEIGQLCALSFEDVTSWTFQVLIEETQGLRAAREAQGQKVGYTAYGYHGTEILLQGQYTWQSYSPYLQGWAKMSLEHHAIAAHGKKISACVFNCPEILTNSSSIFQGVEVPLYALIDAIRKEKGENSANELIRPCLERLQDGTQWNQISNLISDFYQDATVQSTMDFENWPTHTKPAQLEKLLINSQKIFDLHKDQKNLVTTILSERVFDACGYLMLNTALSAEKPVAWINHDVIARYTSR